jgi:hypothetical protein
MEPAVPVFRSVPGFARFAVVASQVHPVRQQLSSPRRSLARKARKRGRAEQAGLLNERSSRMSSLPLACSLSAADLAAVRERYHDAAGRYQAAARLDGEMAFIELTGDKPELRALLDEMIEREGACCPFLTFDLAETPDGFRAALGVVGGAGLEDGLLREVVDTLFPGASSID